MRKIKKAYIEITNMCNLACPFCPGTRRTGAHMSMADFTQITERLSGKIGCLYFHVMGEPLLHPNLGTLLDIAGEARMPVNLTTNGTLLEKVGMELIGKGALRQVNISLHSSPDADRAYLDEVLDFVRMAREDGRIIIALRLWNIGTGSDDVAERVQQRLADEFGLGSTLPGTGTDSRGVTLSKGVYFNRAALFQWPGLHCEELGSSGFCMGLRDQIGVLVDGTVVPCCLDGEGIIALGNLFQQPLDEILASDRAAALYDGFSRREVIESLCKRCGYRKRFG